MTDARASLFAEIGLALRRPKPDAVTTDGLLDGLGSLRPALAASDPIDAFVAKATSERLTASVERLSTMAEIPTSTARYLQQHALGVNLAMGSDPRLSELDWGDLQLKHAIDIKTDVAMSFADYAIAETGSLVFTSSLATPTLMNFLPLHHLAVVKLSTVLPFLEDYWKTAGPPRSRSVNLVTGTSGTADIEGRNVRGAHGPRFLHILMVG